MVALHLEPGASQHFTAKLCFAQSMVRGHTERASEISVIVSDVEYTGLPLTLRELIEAPGQCRQ